MAGDQPQLVAEFGHARAIGDAHDAVLVGGLHVVQPRPARHHRHTRVDAGSFQAGVQHDALACRGAHHGSEHEQALLEARKPVPRVGVVVGIHEDVRAGLQLVVDLARGLVHERAGARTGDRLARNAIGRQQIAGLFRRRRGALDRGAPLGDRAHVLGRAVIRVNAGKAQEWRGLDRAYQLQRRITRRDAAAITADLDFDQHVDHHAGLVGRRRQFRNILGVIDAHRDACTPRKMREPAHLGAPDHFVGHEHVAHAGVDEAFGLAHLLATNADCAGLDLALGDVGAFVALGVRTQARTRAAHGIGHRRQIALEGIEVERQCRRVDLVDRHADRGRRKC